MTEFEEKFSELVDILRDKTQAMVFPYTEQKLADLFGGDFSRDEMEKVSNIIQEKGGLKGLGLFQYS